MFAASHEQLLIVSEHRQRVEKIARKHTRGTSISWEDAAQTAHKKVFEAVKARKFRQGGVKEFYHWAAIVARNEIEDLVRKEKRRKMLSLDETIPGTNVPLLETVADEFNSLDALERADFTLKAIDAIATIDQRYSHRGYLKLWQGLVQGKNQVQLAVELNVSQGEISKRWKELVGRIAQELGLLQADVKREQHKTCKHKRKRQYSGKQG